LFFNFNSRTRKHESKIGITTEAKGGEGRGDLGT